MKNKKLNRRWKHAAKTGVVKNLEDEFAFQQFDNNVFVSKEMYYCKIYNKLLEVDYIQ